MQAAPVTKVRATVIVQETIIYARYSGPCNNTSPTKFPNGSRRNISKDQTIRMGCQGVYSSRTVYVHVHPNQGARICPTQQLIASKGSARVTKLGDAVKKIKWLSMPTPSTRPKTEVEAEMLLNSTATATTQTGNGLVWPKTKMLNIQMKVLEPKWKQEQRRSLQNKVNKYTNCSSRTFICCLSPELKSRFPIQFNKTNRYKYIHSNVLCHCLRSHRSFSSAGYVRFEIKTRRVQ